MVRGLYGWPSQLFGWLSQVQGSLPALALFWPALEHTHLKNQNLDTEAKTVF